MNQATLKKYIAVLPSGPGIYMFKNARKRHLYIGKASNLKSRLNSYLKIEDIRIKKMLDSARSLKFLRTESDIEALILESQLIKRYRPQFNIMMRDDKQYFYVVFTKEKFQKVFLSHQPHSKYRNIEISSFVGPFTDGNALKTTLRFLRSVFPYCTCSQLHHNYCLNYHIGKCLGFCCSRFALRETQLANRGSSISQPNSKEIWEKSGLKNPEVRQYEKNITSVKKILDGKKNNLIKNMERDMARSAKRGDLEKAIELREKLGKLKRVFENAKIIQKSSHTHISIYGYDNEKNNKTESNLIKILGLSKMPVRIEGYDVSNIQGTHATGAMVTFINGQPDKNFYRKFKIYTKQTPDDTAMLKEILERRFRHDEWPFPDLILIDGGKGQVNTAIKTLNKMAIKIPIIGISKNKHHIGHQLIIPGRKSPLSLTKLSPSDRNLFLAIDSEAHRFAIGYYRKLHRKLFK